MKLYHVPASRSCRVRWLLEELGLAHEIVPLELARSSLQSAEYLAINPDGRVPTLVDGETTIWESGAIVEYLLEKYGEERLQPKPGSPERPAYLQWFHWAEATALPPISDLVQHSHFRPEGERIAAVVPDAAARIARCLDVVERALEGRKYIAGSKFTAADVMLGYTIQLTKLVGQLGKGHPNTSAYLNRLAERPAFLKAFSS